VLTQPYFWSGKIAKIHLRSEPLAQKLSIFLPKKPRQTTWSLLKKKFLQKNIILATF